MTSILRKGVVIGCALFLLTSFVFPQAPGSIGGTEGAQQVFNGFIYANAFGAWSVPQGNVGQFTWSDPNICSNLSGLTFKLFQVGLPITIVDANPALSENTTINTVSILPFQCSITTAPLTNTHYSFRIVSGTFGLQEAINYAKQNNITTTVFVTPSWARLGGTTAMITSAQGNANIGITDQRNTLYKAYLWNGSAYVQQGLGGFGITNIDNVPIGQSVPAAGSFTTLNASGSATLSGGGSLAGTFSGSPIVTGNWTLQGSNIFTNINNTLYISQFAGAELGAKMNAAVTYCTVTLGLSACKYIIDVGGTISTAPNFPVGSIVECTNGTSIALASITLATTWNIMHRNTTYNFNGCQFYYNQDAGVSAIVVGKPNVGTVNTAGTGPSTVTFVSGSNFTNIDVCDFIVINGVLYNVASVTPPNTLTVAGNTGTQTGVAYAGVVNSPACGNYLGGVTVRDLNIAYSGAGTTSSVGLQVLRAYNTDLVNLHVRDFTGLNSQGLLFNGALYTSIYKLWLYNNKCQAIIDQSTAGGLTVTSNNNKFILPVVQAGLACGSGVSFDIRAGANNTLDAPDVESNLSTKAVQFNGIGDIVRDGFFQLNGDGTGSSADITFLGGRGNVAENNKLASLVANFPNIGIQCTGASTSCDIRNNAWDPVNNHYGTAWTYLSGATGRVEGNTPGAATFSNPLYGSLQFNEVPSPVLPPVSVLGDSDATGQVAMDIMSRVSGRGAFLHFTDNATFDNCWGVDGATGDLVMRDSCFPGGAGTERFRIKRTTGQISTNSGVVAPLTQTIANGTSALGTSSITSGGTCASTVTTAAPGAFATDALEWSISGGLAANYGNLTIFPFVSANNVNFVVCNPSAATVTPGAMTLIWRVLR